MVLVKTTVHVLIPRDLMVVFALWAGRDNIVIKVC